MATINAHKAKDGSVSYRVRIQRKGQPTISATFLDRKSAVQYGKLVEGQLIAGTYFPQKKTQHSLNALFDCYDRDVMPKKDPESQRSHRAAINYWRERLGAKNLIDITRDDVMKGRDDLNTTRKAATVCKYMVILTHALNIAVKE